MQRKRTVVPVEFKFTNSRKVESRVDRGGRGHRRDQGGRGAWGGRGGQPANSEEEKEEKDQGSAPDMANILNFPSLS